MIAGKSSKPPELRARIDLQTDQFVGLKWQRKTRFAVSTLRQYALALQLDPKNFGAQCGCTRPATPQPEITGPIKLVEFPELWLKRKSDNRVVVNDSILICLSFS